jgi:SPP1 gp7 family putative phage head morphogenesis protein
MAPPTAREDPRRFRQDLLTATDMPFAQAQEFFRGKLKVQQTASWRDMMREQHDRAFTVAGLLCDRSLKDVRRLVQRAIDEGMTERDFRKRLQGALEKHGTTLAGSIKRRARTVYDTNLRTAYAAGRRQQMEAAKEVLPYWVYRHGASAKPRPEHLAMDGKVFRADDPIWAKIYPPNGWGCSCRVEALSRRQLEQLGLKVEGDGTESAAANALERAAAEDGWDYTPGATADPFSGVTVDPDKTFAGRGPFERAGQEWLAALTADERSVVSDYTDFNRGVYADMNAVQRGLDQRMDPEHRAELRAKAAKLDGALSRFELHDDLVVFRGLDLDALPFCLLPKVELSKDGSKLSKLRKIDDAIGRTAWWSDKSFMSSSASSFGAYDKDVVLKIRLRSGSRTGAFVKYGSEKPEEDEFLIRPGARFKITRHQVQQVGPGKAMLLLELELMR